MAESTGLEPVHRYPDDGLAIRCITTLPTLHCGNGHIFNLCLLSRQYIFLLNVDLNESKNNIFCC